MAKGQTQRFFISIRVTPPSGLLFEVSKFQEQVEAIHL